MFDTMREKCKKCAIALQYIKTRIGDNELTINCKIYCRRKKKKEFEPDLFTLTEGT